jgi:hydrogenase-4 component B
MTPGTWLFIATAGLAASIVVGLKSARAWLALTLAGCAAGLVAALTVLLGTADWEWRSSFRVGGELPHFSLDGLNALFLVAVAVIGGLGAVYSTDYWSEKDYPDSAPRGRAWWSGLLLCMGLVLAVRNGLHFLICWELFTISAYFLITLDRQGRATRSAGWVYLAASHAGTVCLFAFFAMLAARTGSWDLGSMRDQAALAPLFWLALAGFGVKAGMFPLHLWLPSAHASAPSHVSAIMSGVAIKMGIYGILRFSGWLQVPPAAGWVVLGLGAFSALFGMAFAIAQNDLKRLLAYCSVENIGVILIGLGCALLGAAHGDMRWGRLALAGALWHVWNHSAFKSLLFFSAGSVLHATGTREMSRLGGLWRRMPWTAGLFGIGCVAVSSLPPLNGFVSECLIYLGLFDGVATRDSMAWAAMPAAIMLAMAGALAAAAFVKAGTLVFMGNPRTKVVEHAHECGPLMLGPMVGIAFACLCLGLAPALFWPVISRAMGSWRPVWAESEPPSTLLFLGACQPVVALAAGLGCVWVWRRCRANGLREGLTWDCGYHRPTARMQYTSASFAGIASDWFFWLLQPERIVRRPRGPLPPGGSRIERVPETTLEHVITPIGELILRVYSAARRLQRGRLQSYIIYVIAGLIAMGLVVWLGGKK